METKANDFLEKQPVGTLMRRYAVPCVISLLAAALYNIVDQLFIAKGEVFSLSRCSSEESRSR